MAMAKEAVESAAAVLPFELKTQGWKLERKTINDDEVQFVARNESLQLATSPAGTAEEAIAGATILQTRSEGKRVSRKQIKEQVKSAKSEGQSENAAQNTPNFKQIDIALVAPSKTNPRKRFSALEELAASIAAKGVLEPLLVRPKGRRFEIVAGERRYRASKLANLDKVPCLVRELSDADAIEIQAIENIQRSDLTPLEEAAAFRQLISTKPDKHSAETIAKTVGKSASWVWDVMKILDLIPEAKRLLDAGKMSINHAIPIARLTPAQQKQVIDPYSGGLFRDERHTLDFDDDDREPDEYDGVQPVSVKELQAYIAQHVRFDPHKAAQAAPLLFDNTAEKVDTAAAKPGRGKKVIAITHNYHVQDSARDPNERTYSTVSWRRADGTKDAPACEQSVLGVVVVGRDYGQAFDVCIARDRCKVHWRPEVAAKEKREREKARSASGATSSKAKSASSAKESEAEKKRAAELEIENKADDLATALVREEAEAKLSKLPKTLPLEVVQLAAEVVDDQVYSPYFSKERKAKRITQANFLSVLIASLARQDIEELEIGFERDWGLSWAAALGVNVKALRKSALQQVKAEVEVQTSGVKK